jgi:hypothetical protein
MPSAFAALRLMISSNLVGPDLQEDNPTIADRCMSFVQQLFTAKTPPMWPRGESGMSA